LVICEILPENGIENFDGVKSHLQGIKDAGDDEVAFLLRATDPEASEDRKCLKLIVREFPVSLLISEVMV
jgi:hypothetical protein